MFRWRAHQYRWGERKEAMLRDNDVVTAAELAEVTGSTAARGCRQLSQIRVAAN